jgi:hypothetical protein
LKYFFIKNTYHRVSTQTLTTVIMRNQNLNQNLNLNLNEYDQQQEEEAAASANYNRILAQMDALDARAAEYHTNEIIREMFRDRLAMINNTDGYFTGNRVLDCRSIQMFDPEDWIALFGSNEPLRPYMQRCMDYAADPHTAPYAGDLEVSLLLEENANPAQPGTHRAVFLVFVTPHRQFETGHIIEVEYGEGSRTQQAINRFFNTELAEEDGRRAVVQQFTEYQILAFLADETQMFNLLYNYFLDGFNPMQFVDEQNADPADAWRLRHECVDVVNDVLHNGVNPNAAVPAVVPVAPNNPAVEVVEFHRPPPPPPINDFAEIYRENYAAAAADHEEPYDARNNIINNFNQYYYNDDMYNDDMYNDDMYNDDMYNYEPERG